MTDTPRDPDAPEGLLDILKRLGPVGILAAAWTLVPAFAGFALVTVWLAPVAEWLQGRGPVEGPVIFAACFMVTAGFGLLPTYAQSFVAGWVFGSMAGVGAALAGFTGAALIGFGITRVVDRDRIDGMIESHPRASVVKKALVGRGGWRTLGIVTLIRIPPNSPFSLTNLVLSGGGVRLGTYLVGTVVGMTPRTAIVAVLAATAATAAAAEPDGAQNLVDVAKQIKREPLLWIGGIVSMIVIVVTISTIANRALARMTSDPAEADSDDRPAGASGDQDGPGTATST